jgi:hypothetical protein
MKQVSWLAIAGLAALAPAALPQKTSNPLVGRWDITVNTAGGARADWLGITDKGGTLEVLFQPPGGNVYQVKEFQVNGSHMTLNLAAASGKNPALVWEIDAAGDKLTGTQKRGDESSPIAGVRAPSLQRSAPKAWSNPEPLFNGKDLTGWVPSDPANNHWTVRGGELVNEAHGANLRTTRQFEDFKLHVDFNCPDGGNSGLYLRGRYEVQIEYEPLEHNPPERRIGSIYGFLTPKPDLPRKPGQWESFDVTLVGRTVTVVRNGVTTIDRQEIPGITGGALDANEGQPGPFYIQGDHTGGLRFRNITVAVPAH